MIAVATFWGSATVAVLITLVTANVIPAAFNGPARQSLIVTLVPREHFPNAASVNGMQWRLSDILVTHHHFVPGADPDAGPPMPGARAHVDAFESMGVDLVLGGHVHHTHVMTSRTLFPDRPGPGVPIIACGTLARLSPGDSIMAATLAKPLAELPACSHQPARYDGPAKSEVLALRRQYLTV